MDTLITIAIFVVVAIISAWLKKKQEPEDEGWTGAPPPLPGEFEPQKPAAPPRPKAARWEEELRKLLDGDAPEAPRPRPIVIREERKPATPPPVAPPVRQRPPPLIIKDDQEIGLPVHFPSLTQSAQAHQRASQLDLKVAERLRQIEQQVTRHTAAPKVERAAREIELAKTMLRSHDSLRSAIVASVILGPPKAFGA